jgi:hypothetical protein
MILIVTFTSMHAVYVLNIEQKQNVYLYIQVQWLRPCFTVIKLSRKTPKSSNRKYSHTKIIQSEIFTHQNHPIRRILYLLYRYRALRSGGFQVRVWTFYLKVLWILNNWTRILINICFLSMFKTYTAWREGTFKSLPSVDV